MAKNLGLAKYSQGETMAFYFNAKDYDGTALDDGSAIEATVSDIRGNTPLVEANGTIVDQSIGRYLVTLDSSSLAVGVSYHLAVWSNHGASNSALQGLGRLVLESETVPT